MGTRTPSTPTASRLAVAQLSVALPPAAEGDDRAPPSELRLVPAGQFRARDGRPQGLPHWTLTAEGAAAILSAATAQADDFVIDYEHQTLRSVENGKPAPAAGWWPASGMEWRAEGDEPGLYATGLRWTARAREAIASGEYRYFSPVIAWDEGTGAVRGVLMGALTNYAGLDGLTDLSAAALSLLGDRLPIDHQEPPMDLAALRKLLALPEDADEAAILAAVTALTAERAQSAERVTQLTADLTAARAATAPDPSQYIPRAVHEETVAALRALGASAQTSELERLITDGLSSGQIPGQRTAEWLRAQGLEVARAYLDEAPRIAALSGTQVPAGAKPKGERADALTVAQELVRKQLGLTPEQMQSAAEEAA